MKAKLAADLVVACHLKAAKYFGTLQQLKQESPYAQLHAHLFDETNSSNISWSLQGNSSVLSLEELLTQYDAFVQKFALLKSLSQRLENLSSELKHTVDPCPTHSHMQQVLYNKHVSCPGNSVTYNLKDAEVSKQPQPVLQISTQDYYDAGFDTPIAPVDCVRTAGIHEESSDQPTTSPNGLLPNAEASTTKTVPPLKSVMKTPRKAAKNSSPETSSQTQISNTPVMVFSTPEKCLLEEFLKPLVESDFPAGLAEDINRALSFEEQSVPTNINSAAALDLDYSDAGALLLAPDPKLRHIMEVVEKDDTIWNTLFSVIQPLDDTISNNDEAAGGVCSLPPTVSFLKDRQTTWEPIENPEKIPCSSSVQQEDSTNLPNAEVSVYTKSPTFSAPQDIPPTPAQNNHSQHCDFQSSNDHVLLLDLHEKSVDFLQDPALKRRKRKQRMPGHCTKITADRKQVTHNEDVIPLIPNKHVVKCASMNTGSSKFSAVAPDIRSKLTENKAAASEYVKKILRKSTSEKISEVGSSSKIALCSDNHVFSGDVFEELASNNADISFEDADTTLLLPGSTPSCLAKNKTNDLTGVLLTSERIEKLLARLHRKNNC